MLLFDLQRLKPAPLPKAALCPRRSQTLLTSRVMLRWERPSVTPACLGEEGWRWRWRWWGPGCERVGRRYEKNPEMVRKVGLEEVRRRRCVKERKGSIMAEVWGASDDDG